MKQIVSFRWTQVKQGHNLPLKVSVKFRWVASYFFIATRAF